jgi:hypothetical protein
VSGPSFGIAAPERRGFGVRPGGEKNEPVQLRTTTKQACRRARRVPVAKSDDIV